MFDYQLQIAKHAGNKTIFFSLKSESSSYHERLEQYWSWGIAVGLGKIFTLM